MVKLHYADGFVVTSAGIAEAVIAYARALAETGTSAVVRVPIIGDSGEVARSTMLIGPASQLYTTPTPGGVEGIEDDPLVQDLTERTAALQPVAMVPDEEGGLNGQAESF
ncbi:hypothetical protein [Microbacterium aureliae]